MESERTPTTDHGKAIRAEVSDARWAQVVADAEARASRLEAVFAHVAEHGSSWRSAVRAVGGGVSWPTFRHHKRHYESRPGPAWERLLDGRVPPDRSYPEEVGKTAVLLRRLDAEIGVSEARAKLVKLYGAADGGVSDTWLKRVWAEAGVSQPRGGRGAGSGVEEQRFHGGGGLALLVAVEAEKGMTLRLAESVQAQGAVAALRQEGSTVVADDGERSADGTFTAAYNARRREGCEPGEADARWAPDEDKAQRRALQGLGSVEMKPETLARKLLAMGVTPMLTERRGFDGLEGPAGQWLGVLGGVAYMPATLDKALAELGVLDVGSEMWGTHACTWTELSGRWCEEEDSWPQSVAYIDGTADPYWTRAFAASGKVSRVNRVMPCLTRLAIHSGAGVPLYVETHAGAASLKKRILPMLEALDRAVGSEAEVDRLTIVDAEVGTVEMLHALDDQAGLVFITVLKGAVLKSALRFREGEWMPFRDRDEVREVELGLRRSGKGESTVWSRFRCVEMRRTSSRKPQVTTFVTNAHADDIGTVEIATRYLLRWPRQEQKFRLGRDGGGLNRSHGYGGARVTHVALENKKDVAARSVAHATRRAEIADDVGSNLAEACAEWPAQPRKQLEALTDRNRRERGKALERSRERQEHVGSMPEEIYVRDTGRDSIMTCLKLNALSMVEYALQEYFGGVRMAWRTFIEQFVHLPVTVRNSATRREYVLAANPRQPERMEQLERALAEINRRQILLGHQLLVFALEREDGG